jgi:hypothetical protein
MVADPAVGHRRALPGIYSETGSLMNEELSMSNALSEVTDRDAMKSLFVDSRRV